jgi:glycosyltransferase involved in cell wall biosynthesis
VAAWALQALAREYDVTLLSWTPPDVEPVNVAFGTTLSDDDFTAAAPASWQRRILDPSPIPLALFTSNLLLRRARALLATDRYDVVVCTMNEISVGRRAIQYIHYPWALEPRPDVDLRWYHAAWPLYAYRRVAARISGHRPEEVAKNLTLANSKWVARLYARCYGDSARILPPPVPGNFPEVPWEEREDRFLCVGRLAREKELPKVMRILDGVRARGHAIRLMFVGLPDHPEIAREVEAAARASKGLVETAYDLPRDELAALMARSRYGIHGMRNEHFGIAPAELQRAGCITFVPDSGGVAEIVEHDPRLVYADEADAILKIDRILSDSALRDTVRTDVARRRERYSAEKFTEGFMRAVHEVEADS